METKTGQTIVEHFSDLKDPRVEQTKLHSLMDILVIAVCAVICEADSWVDMEEYGKAKYEWLKQFLIFFQQSPSEQCLRKYPRQDKDSALQRLEWSCLPRSVGERNAYNFSESRYIL